MEHMLQYATKRIVELESLLLVDVTETIWPAEVAVIATPMAEASKRGELTGIFICWRDI